MVHEDDLLRMGPVIGVTMAKGSIPRMNTVNREEGGRERRTSTSRHAHLFTPHVYSSRPLEDARLLGIVSSIVVL
jgi:hypothetical protein